MIIHNFNIHFFDLEEDDRIEGYKLKDLVLFAKMARKAGITESDLKKFATDCGRIVETIREEIADAAMSSIEGYIATNENFKNE